MRTAHIYNVPDGVPSHHKRHLSGLSRKSKLAKLGMRYIAVVLSDLKSLLKWKSETVKTRTHTDKGRLGSPLEVC